jgi:hypothetical protein
MLRIRSAGSLTGFVTHPDMFKLFKSRSSGPNGPDFSETDSKAKAEARLQRGELERLFLLPAEFGGTDDPRNIVLCATGFRCD